MRGTMDSVCMTFQLHRSTSNMEPCVQEELLFVVRLMHIPAFS